MANFVIPQGKGGVSADVGGSTFNALNMQAHPVEPTMNGHFSVGLLSGIMPLALGVNTEIVQFRWTDAFRYALIHKVVLNACVSTTFFAAAPPWQVDMVKCNTWTAAGTAGTRISPAALFKKRRTQGASLVLAGDIAISSTVALGAGTKVLEGTPMSAVVAPLPITTSLDGTMMGPSGNSSGVPIFQADMEDGECPLILHQNEGFVIRNIAINGIGTWTFNCQIDWSEVDKF